ncbi:hypothetical protein GW796_08170 [archaeon]|nr:hypothetical protein [archaeon]
MKNKRILYKKLLTTVVLMTCSQAFSTTCTDISGHYFIGGVTPSLAPGIESVLEAMKISNSGLADSEIKINNSDTEISLWIKRGRNNNFRVSPDVQLQNTIDFECKGKSVFLKTTPRSGKKLENIYLKGISTVRLEKNNSQGLTLISEFIGSEQVGIYSYESANISINKLGTKQIIRDTILWPIFSEDLLSKPAQVVIPENKDIEAVRKLLSVSVMGNIPIGGIRKEKSEVIVTLNIPKEKDIKSLENRLVQAKIDYRIKEQPKWSDRGYYTLMVVQPKPLASYSSEVKN